VTLLAWRWPRSSHQERRVRHSRSIGEREGDLPVADRLERALQICLGRLRLGVERADEGHRLIAKLLGQLLQRRHGRLAEGAADGPEADHHHAAAQPRQGERLALRVGPAGQLPLAQLLSDQRAVIGRAGALRLARGLRPRVVVGVVAERRHVLGGGGSGLGGSCRRRGRRGLLRGRRGRGRGGGACRERERDDGGGLHRNSPFPALTRQPLARALDSRRCLENGQPEGLCLLSPG
jgi:hypothetical protein